jgi:hypothetical protein
VRRPVARVLAFAALAEVVAGRVFTGVAAELAGVAGVLVTAGAGAGLEEEGVAGAEAGVVPGVGISEVAMADRRVRDWGGEGLLQRSCRQTSAVGLPEINDPADREIGEHIGIRTGEARCRAAGGEHPVAG